MGQDRGLYGALAKHYDQTHHWKDYQAEALKIKGLIARHKRSPGNDLPDIACETGKHTQFLQDGFNCTGVDASNQMLAAARKNAPMAKVREGEHDGLRPRQEI